MYNHLLTVYHIHFFLFIWRLKRSIRGLDGGDAADFSYRPSLFARRLRPKSLDYYRDKRKLRIRDLAMSRAPIACQAGAGRCTFKRIFVFVWCIPQDCFRPSGLVSCFLYGRRLLPVCCGREMDFVLIGHSSSVWARAVMPGAALVWFWFGLVD